MSIEKPLKIITSALPYVNNLPHLGNIIGCVLSSDVYYRYCKLKGENVIHICGTDEYGTATEIKAIELGKHPKDLCEENSAKHKAVYDWFDIEFTKFGRTSTNEYHTATVHEIFNRLYENGFFEENEGMQFYCKDCELFLADRYIMGECVKCESENARGDQCDDCGFMMRGLEMKNPRCALCQATPAQKKTKHLFIKLNSLQNELKEFYSANGHDWSENAKKITESWLNLDLHPRCMTRDLKYKWGVSVPIEGYHEKVFYVWFDAPIGYFTFIKDVLGSDYYKYIKDPTTKLYQFMGKDNVPFHSIIFPAMLMGTKDNYKLVDVISCTEYLMFEGGKFSKSRGIGIFGNELTGNEMGQSCFWRYYLIKIRPEEKDSTFTYADFFASIKADLIDKFGNFVNRVLKYVSSKMDSKLDYTLTEDDHMYISEFQNMYQRFCAAMDKCRLKEGIKIMLEIAAYDNMYVQTAFNETNKKDAVRKNTIFSVACSVIFLLGNISGIFMPKTGEKIAYMLNTENTEFKNKFALLENGHKIRSDLQVLFKPFTAEQEEKIQGKK